MRILFFTDHFKPEPSAPAAHVFERSRLWASQGHDVTVICAAPNFPEGKVYAGYKNHWRKVEQLDGIKVIRVKTFVTANEGIFLRTLDYLSYFFSALFFSLFEKKPDVVISTSPHLFAPMAGVLFSIFRRVPHVFELRDIWPASIIANTNMSKGLVYNTLETLELWMYRRSTTVMAFTNAYKTDLVSRGIDSSKIFVVINGANLELFTPRCKNSAIVSEYDLEGKCVIGYLGTIGLSHGLENAIEAAKILKDQPIVFLFVGVGAALGAIKEMAKKYELPNVIFAGRKLKEEMPEYWSVCDISLIHLENNPQFATVIPSKIFESMAMGLPIVYVGPEGSEGGEIVVEHKSGVVVPAAQPGKLAEQMRALCDDRGTAGKFAKNSLESAPRYSRERQASETIKVFEKALEIYKMKR